MQQLIKHEETSQWLYNHRDGVSNHRRLGCLLNRFFRRTWKEASKLSVTGLCERNQPVTGGFPHKGPVTRKRFPFDDVIMEIMFEKRFHNSSETLSPSKDPLGHNSSNLPPEKIYEYETYWKLDITIKIGWLKMPISQEWTRKTKLFLDINQAQFIS